MTKTHAVPQNKGTFHERFEISVNIDEAKAAFVNRVFNRVFGEFLADNPLSFTRNEPIRRDVAFALGVPFDTLWMISDYTKGDFYKCLQALEAIHRSLSLQNQMTTLRLSSLVTSILESSEIDLGIKWEDGVFLRTGAPLLDHSLVNEPLRWLSQTRLANVRAPFQKGLSHYLESEKKPEVLADVVTDMYESLEALVKVVTGRPSRDLSANAELFIQKIRASQSYKQLLKDYIAYANNFRHGIAEGQKPTLTSHEVESFIYLTGIFIRLVITSGALPSA